MGRKFDPKPIKKSITRYETKDGKRVTSTTPGARKIQTLSETYYVRLPADGRYVFRSLETPDLQLAWHRLNVILLEKKQKELGIFDDASQHASRPISEHIADWLASLKNLPITEKQRRQLVARVSKLADKARWQKLADIKRGSAQAALSILQTDGLSAQTRNHYLSHVHQFVRWLLEEKRITADPLDGLASVSVESDRRHDRRIPTDEEIGILFDHLNDQAPIRKGMVGPCRALAYMTAMASGLRAGELRSLDWAAFNLENGTIRLRAASAKNRRRTMQTIPSWLCQQLQAWKDAGGILWDGFPADWPGRLLKADLAAARQQWIDAASSTADKAKRERSTVCLYEVDSHDGPLFWDFHSLRHWYVTQVAGLEGISPSTMQALVRHSDPKLTLQIYAKSKSDQVRTTVDKIRLPNK